MEVECASYCSSLEAICEDSEMIAHLQSLFWSSSDANPFLGSSNNSFSLSSSSSFSLISNGSYDTMGTELVNNSTNICFEYRDDSLFSLEETSSIGNKRKNQMDTGHEQMMNHSKEVCTAISDLFNLVSDLIMQCLQKQKRRQRINERLKILQELIPNGTKVDISTMLEEAIQYIKFLHLQIKLLSSDEMWMYAPLAFDGVNNRLHQNNSLSLE
uniref:BHLH domain-containing protein n=1 Tax=Leersia perrieri TaxID=77586 RepID=A0A0D9XZQ7_9ORYZ